MADIFSKIIKDYNNELERILEKKGFENDVRSLLLSMLYKIENGYDDYKKVKVNVCSKNQFIEEILETISKMCNKIEIIKPNSELGRELYKQDKSCIINKTTGEIQTLQNEKSILDALMLIRQEDIKINEEYDVMSTPIKEMLLLGNNMNSLELITDFNGWSWDLTTKGKKNTTYNYLYQLLLMLIGNELIDKWVNKRKLNRVDEIPSNVILSSKYNENYGITKKEILGEEIDYISIIREDFKQVYGEKLEKEFFEIYSKILILECSKNSNEFEKEIKKHMRQIEKKLKTMSDNKTFIEDLTKQKKELTKQIEKIDKILCNEKELKKEYNNRNAQLPNDEKIFSVSHLKLMLGKERYRKLGEIKNINKKMEPKEFVNVKTEIEKRHEFYKDINIEDKTEENFKRLQIRLEKVFLKCFAKKIKNSEGNSKLENLIYELRYFELALSTTSEIASNSKYLKSIEKDLIEKSCDSKLLTTLSENKQTNYMLLREVFTSRIIDLDTIAFKLKYNKGILTINIFDGTTDDETKQIKLTEKTELSVKLNKKIRLWQ